VNSYEGGDDASARSNATTLIGYIDQNLPGMQQLANNADTEQPAAREFVLSLVDLRNSMAYLVKSIDYEKAGDFTDAATALGNATALQRSEQSHLENMFPRTPTTPVPTIISTVE
jgi:predicted ATPase